jgi:gluconolactonase
MHLPQVAIDRFEVFATGLDHPECIAFDRAGDLWAGGEAGQIYRIDRKGSVSLITSLGSFNGGIAFSPDDELFVCNPAQGIVRVRRDGGHSVFARQAGSHRLVAPNFGLFDARGNYYVTDSGQWKKQNGMLLRFNASGDGEAVTGPLGYANGLAMTADCRTMYLAETDSNRVFRLPVSNGGDVGPPEIFAEGVGRMLDGLALAADGSLLACCYASDEIWRIDARGRKELIAHDPNAILLGAPTNMAFGGEDLQELYVANLGRYTVTRARIGLSGQPLVTQRER